MSLVSHFRYFQPYTRCNKFSGETLNINLLLCPFFSLHLALVCEHQTRMLAVPWMTCGTFWEKLTHTKNTEHYTFFTRVCACCTSKWSHIYQWAAGVGAWPNWAMNVTCTFRFNIPNSMQDNVPFDTHIHNLWRLLFHFISWLDTSNESFFSRLHHIHTYTHNNQPMSMSFFLHQSSFV